MKVLPASTKAQVAVDKEANQPDGQKIKRGEHGPDEQQAEKSSEGGKAENLRRPRAPGWPRFALVCGKGPTSWIFHLGLTKQRYNAQGIPAKFKLKIGRRANGAAVLWVHHEGEHIAFGEQHRRVAAPVKLAVADFAGLGQRVDGGVERGKNSVVEEPNNCRRRYDGEDGLHDEQALERGAGKSPHAARRDGLPGKTRFGERAHAADDATERTEKSALFFGSRRLVRRGGQHDRHRVAEFHDIIHEDFDVIRAGDLKLDLAEKHHVRCAERGVAQLKFHFALVQHRRLVRRDEADGFVELADARRPTVEEADAAGDDGQLRHADEIHDPDEEQVAIGFLADFLADERALKIGENSGGLHWFES